MRTAFEIVKAHYDANDRRDMEGMLADIGPETEWTEMAGFPCAGTYIGPEAVVENVFKVLGSTWDGYALKIDRLIDGGDTIVGIGTYTGTYRKTGKAMTARVTHVWDLKDGKVVQFEQVTDTLLVAEAMR